MSENNLTEPLWTTKEVASYLRIKPTTVTFLARKNQIPCIRIGHLYRFRQSDITQWLEGQKRLQAASQ